MESTGDIAHLWVVCAKPDEGERVIVSVTSDGPHITDRACEIKAGEHEFVKHPSLAVFRKAKIVTVGDLTSWEARGNFRVKQPASDQLVSKLREGALDSKFTPRDVKQAIRECWWSPE